MFDVRCSHLSGVRSQAVDEAVGLVAEDGIRAVRPQAAHWAATPKPGEKPINSGKARGKMWSPVGGREKEGNGRLARWPMEITGGPPVPIWLEARRWSLPYFPLMAR